MIMTGQATPLMWTFEHRGKPLSIKVRAHVEANSFVVLGELVARGHGIARLPDYMAADLAEKAPACAAFSTRLRPRLCPGTSSIRARDTYPRRCGRWSSSSSSGSRD
jgi:DNA-binding transcriptional LysR family regulator